MSDFIDKAFIFLVAFGGLYFMIFHTAKCKEVTEVMTVNTGTAVKAGVKGAKGLFWIIKLFTK